MHGQVIVTEVESRAAGSLGGTRLRVLREARGRTQLWVEVEANLGTGYLQRLESGRVRQPSRATVERILAALEARHGEARDVLEVFGYIVSTPLPTEADRRWARDACQPDLDELMFPAYALDCAARLVAWNDYLPGLLALRPGASLPGGMTRRSLLFSWFDPTTPLGATVAEPEALYPAMARALRFELEQHHGAPWTQALVAELQALPRFRTAWAEAARAPLPATATRARTPLHLRGAETGPLEFRLAAEPFAQDPRFRTIFLFPADPATIRWCAERATRAEQR